MADGGGDEGTTHSVGGDASIPTGSNARDFSGGTSGANAGGEAASRSSHPESNESVQGGVETPPSTIPATEANTTDIGTEGISPVVSEALPGSRTGKKRLLLHYIVSVLLFNIAAIWSHLTVYIPADGASRGASATSSAGKNEMAKTIILDFVGIGE